MSDADDKDVDFAALYAADPLAYEREVARLSRQVDGRRVGKQAAGRRFDELTQYERDFMDYLLMQRLGVAFVSAREGVPEPLPLRAQVPEELAWYEELPRHATCKWCELEIVYVPWEKHWTHIAVEAKGPMRGCRAASFTEASGHDDRLPRHRNAMPKDGTERFV